MAKKNQIYLSAFIMYLVAGFAGYLTNISSYWMVLMVSALLCAYTLLNVFSKEDNLREETMVEWISVCGFLGLEAIITLCVCVFNVRYVGFFKYFNYGVQILGLLFVGYSLVKYVLTHTETYGYVKNKFSKAKKEEEVIVTKEEPVNEVALEVQEVIAKEEVKEDINLDIDTSDIEIVGETAQEDNSVKSLELKTAEIETPYMEEEI